MYRVKIMRITHIAAEFAPIAKAGGLGEVLTGLCRQLTLEYEDVDVLIPKYRFISNEFLPNLIQKTPDFECVEHGISYTNRMWHAEVEGCRLHLLETDHPQDYFGRPHIYGYPDDLARFIYFSRAALEYLRLLGRPIDILHLHEWHTAILAPLVKEDFAKKIEVKSVVFTIHNLEYQGKCASRDLDAIGMDGSYYLSPSRSQDPEHPHSINLMKGAIVYADAITTVSPSYAKEILTPSFGCNLENTLLKYKKKLTGILNGIDQKLWNPTADHYLSAPFSEKDSLVHLHEAKEANRRALAKTFGLDASKRPWVGAITRLVPQKGLEMLEEGLEYTVKQGGVFVLLGTSPFELIERHFEKLRSKYGGSSALIQLSYDEALAHRIYASLDFSLIPSLFEPCGLTQLISMRYGTVPIVRATGGLKDTVFDCDDYTVNARQRNGFIFLQPKEFSTTLSRAFSLQKQDPATFQDLMRRGLQFDSRWKKPALQYLKLYRQLADS